MTVNLVNLPAEVLLQILKHLSHGDLNRMTRVCRTLYTHGRLVLFQAINDSFYLQVCRRLYALGTLPSLWRHFNLKVKFKKKESHRVLFIAQTLKRVTGIYRWINPGWQKLRGSTGGTRRKVWTRTKILSPNIRYFVAN